MPTTADISALGEFAASRHSVFTRTEAADHGISRHVIARLIRDGGIEVVHPHVFRFVAAERTWQQDVFSAVVGTSAVASHASAAALHRLDGHTDPPNTPHVLCGPDLSLRRLGAQVHRTRSLADDDLTSVGAIPCTTMARTICDVASDSTVNTDALIQMVDDVQRRGSSMLWLHRTASRLKRTGRSGPPRVLEIVERRIRGYVAPESWFERLLKRCLVSPILVDLQRQFVLRGDTGSFIARFDLALPWLRLAIEGHSRAFHFGELPEHMDEDRDIRAAQEGWEVVYLGFAATRSPEDVCAAIERIALRRMGDLGLAPPTRAA